MKKTFLILSLVLVAFQIGKTQKTFSISGQVISAINKKPLLDYEGVSVGIANDPKSVVNIDSIGKFKIQNLKEGVYKVVVLDIRHKSFDTTVVVAQKDIKGLTILLPCECIEFNKSSALDDIANDEPKLLLKGGIAPFYDDNQEVTEKKYKFKYYEFGCQVVEWECAEAYSSIIFKHLDKKFGYKWRNDVRNDVLFLKNKN